MTHYDFYVTDNIKGSNKKAFLKHLKFVSGQELFDKQFEDMLK
jgi:hypothetical protein